MAIGTCLGPLSRNRKTGVRLAKGESLEDILKSSGGVSEGNYSDNDDDIISSVCVHMLI